MRKPQDLFLILEQERLKSRNMKIFAKQMNCKCTYRQFESPYSLKIKEGLKAYMNVRNNEGAPSTSSSSSSIAAAVIEDNCHTFN